MRSIRQMPWPPLAVALTAMLLGTATASARIERVTLTGTSERITDTLGVFGFGSARTITNERFIERFFVDTGVNPNGFDTGVYSNSIFDAAPPFAVAASLTINGRTFATAGSNYSGLYTGGDYQILSNDAVGDTGDENNFYLDLTGAGLPPTISQAVRLQLAPGQVGNASFIDAASGGYYADASGTLDPTRLTVTGVAEPASWGLLLAGFAVVGSAARRRRATVAG